MLSLYRIGAPHGTVRSIPWLLYNSGSAWRLGNRSMLAFWIGGAASHTDFLLDESGGDLLDDSGGKLTAQ